MYTRPCSSAPAPERAPAAAAAQPGSRAQTLAAFGVVYVVWGSTYLAIRVGVQSLPPALFSGARFAGAGLLMLAYARWRGAAWPRGAADWGGIALTAALLLVGANGLVTWSEQWVESSQAALIVATSALWLAALGALGARGDRVGAWTAVGLGLGLGGVAILVGAGLSSRVAPPLAYAALIASPLLWSCGSIYSRRRPTRCAPAMAVALQLLIGGAAMLAIGAASGELPRWSFGARALAATAYLAVFGSCLAYGSYLWLLPRVRPALLGTYAYVNPAIAVLLGAGLLDERLGPAQLAGTAVILAAVGLVTAASRPTGPRARLQE